MSNPTNGLNLLKLPFPPGTWVLYRLHPWRFLGLSTEGKAIIHCLDHIQPLEVDLRELGQISQPQVDFGRLRPFSEYPEEKQEEAQRRWVVIDQLLRDGLSKTHLEDGAKQLGISQQTLTKLLDWYIFSGGRKAALIPRVLRYGVSNHNLAEGVELIVAEAMEIYHKNRGCKPFRAAMNFVQRNCEKRNFDVPCEETVRGRIHRLPPDEVLLFQKGRKAVREMYEPLTSRRPDAPHPLGKIEIDHTRMNVFAVDRDGRKRRPWITVAIDDYSRAVLGFYISFDAPSWTSVGLCLYRVLCPKEPWLREFGLSFPWPCWGHPKVIQTDSGEDFKGTDMEYVSLDQNWVVQWRLLKQPDYGGRIERLMGAVGYALDFLPGKSFRSIVEKGDYPSAELAVLTLDDLELYLLKFFAIYYNNHAHRGLRNRTPLNRWSEGMKQYEDAAKLQLPPEPTLLMSLLPSIERTIQQNGVSWETVTYIDYSLTRYIRRKNPDSLSGKYRFHYHPADIRYLYFRHTETREWVRIRAQDLGNGPFSLWERDARNVEDRLAAKDDEAKRRSDLGLSMMMDQADEHDRVSLKAHRRKKKSAKQQNKLSAHALPTLSMSDSTPGPRRLDLVPTDPSKYGALPTELDPSLWDDIPDYEGRLL